MMKKRGEEKDATAPPPAKREPNARLGSDLENFLAPKPEGALSIASPGNFSIVPILFHIAFGNRSWVRHPSQRNDAV